MLAALLTNLPLRSAASRYWYAAPDEQVKEVVQQAVQRLPEARMVWLRVEKLPDFSERFRAAAQAIDLAVSHTQAEQTLEAFREMIDRIEEEEAFVVLFH